MRRRAHLERQRAALLATAIRAPTLDLSIAAAWQMLAPSAHGKPFSTQDGSDGASGVVGSSSSSSESERSSEDVVASDASPSLWNRPRRAVVRFFTVIGEVGTGVAIFTCSALRDCFALRGLLVSYGSVLQRDRAVGTQSPLLNRCAGSRSPLARRRKRCSASMRASSLGFCKRSPRQKGAPSTFVHRSISIKRRPVLLASPARRQKAPQNSTVIGQPAAAIPAVQRRAGARAARDVMAK